MTQYRALARVTIVGALLLGLVVATLLPGLTTVKASPAQAILDHVVISQFRTSVGLDGANEFVEIFNATAGPVSLNGWSLRRSSSCGAASPSPIFSYPNITLSPGQYYLVAGLTYNGATTPDAQPAGGLGIADDGGIALFDNANATPVDQVGMCNTTTFVDLPALSPLSLNSDWSYRRPPDASGASCVDTNHNASDFTQISPSVPHDSASALTPCTNPTPTSTNTPTSTSTPVLPPMPSADDIVISEVRFSGSGANSGTNEFIELFNRNCSKTFDLSSIAVLYSDGSGGTSPLGTFAQYTILAPGHFFLLGNTNYRFTTEASRPDVTYGADVPDDGGVAVVLASDNSVVIDEVGLSSGSAYKEGSPAAQPNTSLDQSDGRKTAFTGAFQDTNNNLTDFQQQASDPRNSTQAGTCGVFNTPTPSATRTPVGSFRPRVIINEVGWAGTGANHADQWIELFNPSTFDVPLAGWSLEGTGFNVNLRGTLLANHYYLLVHGETADATQAVAGTPTQPALATPPACLVFWRPEVDIAQVFSDSLSPNGQALFLINANNIIEDSADRNNKPWPAGNYAPAKSMERAGPIILPDTTLGAWFTYDGDASDTPHDCDGNHVRGTPGYQNWSFGRIATPSPTAAPTKKPTPRAPTPFPHMVINEFLPRAGTDWNQDGSINVFDEFIELKNLGPIAVNLQGWKIDVLAAGPANSYTLPAKTLQPGERVLYYGSMDGLIQPDSGATVRLWNNRGVLIDARSYGPVADPDVSHCRIPDGYYWQDACFPTPGTENSLTGKAPAAPPAVALQPPPCLLADIVPQPFREAECSPYGAGIFNPAYWDDMAGMGKFLVQDMYSKWRSWVQ